MMLWPAPFAATTAEAASEFFWNCATWEAGNARALFEYYAGAPERLTGRQIPVSGGIDVTDAGIDVKGNEDLTTIEIELTNHLTEATGLVADERGEPVKDYAVVIFPRDRQRWESPSRSVRTARSDQDGRFKIGGLPSGEYFACAVDIIEPGQESDPEFLDRIRALAAPFSLAEGEAKTLSLKLNAVP